MLPTEAAHSFALTRVVLGVQIKLIKISLLLLHPLHQTKHLKHSTLCTSQSPSLHFLTLILDLAGYFL